MFYLRSDAVSVTKDKANQFKTKNNSSEGTTTANRVIVEHLEQNRNSDQRSRRAHTILFLIIQHHRENEETLKSILKCEYSLFYTSSPIVFLVFSHFYPNELIHIYLLEFYSSRLFLAHDLSLFVLLFLHLKIVV